MACLCETMTAGIPIGCLPNQGGIRKMYITEQCNIASYGLSSPGNEIGTITMIGGAVFFEFEFTKKSGSMYTEEVKPDLEKGITLITQKISLKLNRREKTKRDKLGLLRNFKDLVIIVKDSNGINWLFGEVNGVNLESETGGSGAQKSDANGYAIEFLGEEPASANTVTDAALAAVI